MSTVHQPAEQALAVAHAHAAAEALGDLTTTLATLDDDPVYEFQPAARTPLADTTSTSSRTSAPSSRASRSAVSGRPPRGSARSTRSGSACPTAPASGTTSSASSSSARPASPANASTRANACCGSCSDRSTTRPRHWTPTGTDNPGNSPPSPTRHPDQASTLERFLGRIGVTDDAAKGQGEVHDRGGPIRATRSSGGVTTMHAPGPRRAPSRALAEVVPGPLRPEGGPHVLSSKQQRDPARS